MVLSKRERWIFILAGAGLALLAADRLVIEPLRRQGNAALADRNKKLAELQRIQRVQDDARQARPKWAGMIQNGLKADPDNAEALVQHAMLAWTREAGVSQTLLKPDRLTAKSRLPAIEFQFTGTGSMAGLGLLLHRIQTATIPIRVTDLQITSRKEGSDELSVQMKLSTLYAPPRAGAVAESRPAEAALAQAGAPQPDPVRIRSRRRVTPSTASRPTTAAWAASEPAAAEAETTQPASAPFGAEPAATESPTDEFDSSQPPDEGDMP